MKRRVFNADVPYVYVAKTQHAGGAAQGRDARASNYTESHESFGSPQAVQDFLMSQEELAIS